ncbi:MAG TPA: hypothetical protein VGB63_18440 [Pedobacter sp.]|jgi:hypothetical protein
MLLRFAKLAGGLRLLITEAGPLVATSVALLSARSVAYIVGFGLGSIVGSWLPIIALLISITGLFGSGNSNTPECERYRAQMRAIDDANRAAFAAWQVLNRAYVEGPYRTYQLESQALAARSAASARSNCAEQPTTRTCTVCGSFAGSGSFGPSCVTSVCNPRAQCEGDEFRRLNTGLFPPAPPPAPAIQRYPTCTAPNCGPGKKVWTQVIWASQGEGNFTDAKGCFIVAFSQDAPTLPPNVEYNPFLDELFVKSRALNYFLVNGDRYRSLRDNSWRNLESVEGWDKGYWRSEVVDSECRGWRPGWSKIIK